MSRPPSLSLNPQRHQDAVRVVVLLCEDSKETNRKKFSVDPQLTTYDVLKNLIARAFDMNGDVSINYKAVDDYGGEAYLPMVSDWDLSAAFLSACHPDLNLIVEERPGRLNAEYDEDPWDVIKSNEVLQDSSQVSYNNMYNSEAHNALSAKSASSKSSNASSHGYSSLSKDALMSHPAYLNINSKINTAGLLNTMSKNMEKWVRKAKTFVEDLSVVTSRPPLSDVEFRNYLDQAGVLVKPKELRYACYHGGIEPSLRKVVWKHLLNLYPDGLKGNARLDYIRQKSKEYYDLRDTWKNAIQNGQVSEEVQCVSNMVRKDVLRTDRHLKFFAGKDDNHNVALLFNVLTTFALNHPSTGYCQGMSDLAAPLLVTMGDEAQAYVCFCSLMQRMKANFSTDGLAMSLKFAHLSDLLAYYDPDFWSYLKSISADDLLFCYRWLLLEMKREFAFEDALRMMEVLWASLPYQPQDILLFEVKYSAVSSSSIPIPVPSLSTSYSKLCALRRSTTALNTSELKARKWCKRQKNSSHLSLDETSLKSLSRSQLNASKGHKKPFHSLDESMEVMSAEDFSLSSPFEILSISSADHMKPKMVRNLKEFWQIGKSSSLSRASDGMSSGTLSIEGDGTTGVFYEDEENASDSSNSNTLDQKLEDCDAALSGGSCNIEKEQQIFHDRMPDRGDSVMLEKVPSNNDDNSNSNLHGKQKPLAQGTAADSEYDSGHCCGESVDFDENSIEEPGFSAGGNMSTTLKTVPPPEELGGGNPFLMFLCLAILTQYKDHVMDNGLDYNETAMFFDKMIRKHNVNRVLTQARHLYSSYLKQHVSRA